MDEESDYEDDLVLADKDIEYELSANTKRQYLVKIEQLKDYCSKKYPTVLDSSGDVIVPLPAKVIKAFMGSVSYHDDGKPKANSTVGGYRSAICWLHTKNNVKVVDEAQGIISRMIGGHKRKIQKMKQDGEIKVLEGKLPISFSVYTKIIEYSLKKDSDFNQMLFSHVYITMCWNLMSRSNNVALLLYQHITWENDSLLVTLPKHKGDQVFSMNNVMKVKYFRREITYKQSMCMLIPKYQLYVQ